MLSQFFHRPANKKVELEKRIAENMARLGGSHEFWEKRLTHGWDALETKLKNCMPKV